MINLVSIAHISVQDMIVCREIGDALRAKTLGFIHVYRNLTVQLIPVNSLSLIAAHSRIVLREACGQKEEALGWDDQYGKRERMAKGKGSFGLGFPGPGCLRGVSVIAKRVLSMIKKLKANGYRLKAFVYNSFTIEPRSLHLASLQALSTQPHRSFIPVLEHLVRKRKGLKAHIEICGDQG
jgi:hypothetical protein